MNLQIYLSEDKKKITLCDEEGKCEVFDKVEAGTFTIEKKKKRKSLSDKDRRDIAKRFREMWKTGEDVMDIARSYEITEMAVYRISKRVDLVPLEIKKKIISLSTDSDLNSQDISEHLGVPYEVVNQVIIRHRSIPKLR